MNYPKISIIIPCRNEEKFMAQCLDSLILGDYPKEKMEILVIDGNSKDATQKIVNHYAQKYPFIRLLINTKEKTPFALNIGITQAAGEVIVRIDAHAKYSNDYISKCVRHLYESGADNVGGVIQTLPGGNSFFAKAIAKTYSHPVGVGNAFFRTGSKEPMPVDTVFGGCFKALLFKRVGLFNENLARSQDMEFNARLRKLGGKIYLFPDIVSYYYAKSTIKDFFKHNFEDGVWAVYPLKFVKMPFSFRHYVPLMFVVVLCASLLLGIFYPPFLHLFFTLAAFYLACLIYFSLTIAVEQKDATYLFTMPVAFMARHFGYGIGSIFGIMKLI